MNIDLIISMYNVERKTLKEIAKSLGVSKSTIQRFITKNGYSYNSNSKLYEKLDSVGSDDNSLKNDNVQYPIDYSNEMIVEAAEPYFYNNLREFTGDKIVRDKSSSEKMVSGSYTIPQDLSKALKFKAIYEDKKVVDILREALIAYVEEKYYRF